MLMEDHGLGPDGGAQDGVGLIYDLDEDRTSLPSVYCTDGLAAALLQAELTSRDINIEIRMEERPPDPQVDWQVFMRNGGNVEGP
jgi:hypothetical protein